MGPARALGPGRLRATHMSGLRWDRYPLVHETTQARTWLTIQDDLGLTPGTIDAYGRALQDYLRCLAGIGVDPQAVTREHVARYVGDLRSRPSRRAGAGAAVGLSNATLQQRLTAARLFHDFLVEE